MLYTLVRYIVSFFQFSGHGVLDIRIPGKLGCSMVTQLVGDTAASIGDSRRRRPPGCPPTSSIIETLAFQEYSISLKLRVRVLRSIAETE